MLSEHNTMLEHLIDAISVFEIDRSVDTIHELVFFSTNPDAAMDLKFELSNEGGVL